MGDFFRLWWGLFYWNARKTAFVVRRGRVRCPCQSPSDSGRAGVTHCDAAMTWDRPERFRRVCPALRRGADGWMCSVDTADVRPHWGRALAWWGGATLALYVLAGVAAAGLFRGRGYRDITPLDTLLPMRWERLAAARRAVFLRQAHAALAQHDVAGMWVSLASAAATAPVDYEGRLALAQIYSHLRMGSLADAEFRELLKRFPAQRDRTAVVFHDVLISLGQFDAMGQLALAQLAASPASEQASWINALVVALRGSRDPGQLLRSGGDVMPALPKTWQDAIRTEALVRSGGSAAPNRWPEIPVTKDNAALLIMSAETMADLAPPSVAIDTIVRASPGIGPFESERLLHRLHARIGSEKLARKSFDAMLALARTPGQRERLLAALVDFPDEVCAGRLESALGGAAPFSREELGSVWVAAVMGGNEAVRQLAERRLQQSHAITVPPDTPRRFSPASAMVWVKVLPLTRPTATALALRVARAVRGPADAPG